MAEDVKTQDIMRCSGRNVLYTTYDKIDETNIIQVLKDVACYYKDNQAHIWYLDDYRKGITPILFREKKVRPDINNKVVVNRASEIVAFKVGYLLTEPVQYTARGTSDSNVSDMIKALNDYMYISGKEFYDRELAEKFSVAGTSYRLVLPAKDRDNESPFDIYDLDTANSFVIYNSGLGHKPVLGGIEIITKNENGDLVSKFCCYTETDYFEILWAAEPIIEKQEKHEIDMIPVIEYPNNASRLGDFELVIPLLDTINIVYSNRIDGVEQFVQSLLKFINCDISAEDFEKLKDLGAIKIKSQSDGSKADVEFITQELDQNGVQTLVNSLYQDILTICGMPNRNGGSSTSDTGAAVIMRDGWESAESRAKATEIIFKNSEKQVLKIVLKSMRTFKNIDLALKDIDIKLPRRNYENINNKATVLTSMLASDKIEPKLAFESCGLFTDPEVAYIMSKNYADQLQKYADKLEKDVKIDNKGDNNE